MTILHIEKKVSALLIVLIFTLNLVFSTSIVADFDEDLKDEGIWFDTFDDTDGIEDMVSCAHNGNYIQLSQGNPPYEYNFFNDSNTADIWTLDETFLDNSLLTKLSQFVSPDLLPGEEINDNEEKSKVGTFDDGETLVTKSILYSSTNRQSANPIHHFRFVIEQEKELIENVVIEWWFGDYVNTANLKEITMYVWGYGDFIPKWESFAETTIEYNEDNIKNGSSADITFPPFESDEYISEDGYIDILVIGIPDEEGYSYLYTDFIKTTVTTVYGYMPNGYIISDLINPSDFGGWENVFWTSSKYSEKSGVEIQVLDENKTLIDAFNSTSSPLDISDIEESKIRLKAKLHSSSPTVTPKIYDWGVMLQNKDRYFDSLSNSYRIQGIQGLKQENGFINISEFYNEWEFFGKNSANTRAYDGITITDDPSDYTWYSDFGVGGAFRTPVTSDGIVYVASADKRVYAFNETADSKLFPQEPIDISKHLEFSIDACIAVAEDCLIVGSSDFGKENKLYALNKNNLSEENWHYPIDDDKICFSSPPSISNGVLYISTWGGNIWDLPFLSKLGPYLGSNNKLLAINIDNGDVIWQKKLPAASISTPTIGDEFVFVGCQNMYGSSLWAYDTDEGNEIWNQSVGIIGRSAPVYADGKIFASANEKESISDKGENKIIALDALNGEILWNKTIGEMDASQLLQLLKGRSFFYKLIEGFAPVTTPAYYEDTLYIVSPNGNLSAVNSNGSDIWSYDLTTSILGMPSFYTCSPMIVDDVLYVITGDAMVYAIDIDSSSIVEPLWNYKIETPEEYKYEFYPPNVMASPVLANGLLIVSLTESTHNISGRLYTIGEYAPNSQGTVTSTVIHVPSGYWWSNFSADNKTTENNTIKYSILNQNDLVLKDNLNGATTSISNINSSAIKIHGFLNVGNYAETMPSIDSWQITWTPEEQPPEFINDSFEPGEDGWVNLDLEECSIEAQDVEDEAHNDLLSGLDISTAKFRLGYIPEDSDTAKDSDWYTATSDSGSGVKRARITANIQDLDLSMKKLLNITFSIDDLAGNSAEKYTTEFRIDTVKPSSNITNIDEILEEYNDVFVISADAEDNEEFSGDPNVSGVSKVALKYQYKNSSNGNWGEWTIFSQKSMPASWYFGKDETTDELLPSGYYRLITVAIDKAGNNENLDVSKATNGFLFDITPPEMLTEFDDEYTLATLPEFDLSTSDDFELYGLYYKLDSATTFASIELGINQKTYETKWTMPEADWAEILDGESHDIYFKITDSVGNDLTTTTTITRDNEISNIYVDLSDFSDWNWEDKFTITAQIAEDITVDQAQLFYSYSEDNQTWTEYKQVGESLTDSPFSWEFTATNGSGHYKFYTKIIDTSGVVYTSSAETINLTLIPTHHVILVIFLGMLLILATIYVIRKTRKEKQD